MGLSEKQDIRFPPGYPIVINLTFLYNSLTTVIPAKAGIQIERSGFRIESGMTKILKVICETES
jgi:hypothetical protein